MRAPRTLAWRELKLQHRVRTAQQRTLSETDRRRLCVAGKEAKAWEPSQRRRIQREVVRLFAQRSLRAELSESEGTRGSRQRAGPISRKRERHGTNRLVEGHPSCRGGKLGKQTFNAQSNAYANSHAARLRSRRELDVSSFQRSICATFKIRQRDIANA